MFIVSVSDALGLYTRWSYTYCFVILVLKGTQPSGLSFHAHGIMLKLSYIYFHVHAFNTYLFHKS
jgi:hypothetical protein